MRFFNPKRNFRVMRHRGRTAVLSAVLVAVSLAALAIRGPNFSVDFTGGTLVEVAASASMDAAGVRAALAAAELPEPLVQTTSDGAYLLRLQTDDQEAGAAVLAALQAADPAAELRRIEFVGPQVSDELFTAGALALVVVCAGIVVYLSLRFKWRMAVGAIVANFHDVVFILGTFSLFGWEFNLAVLAAVLAILGYSVNESVVIFDRVRENLRKSRANVAIVEVLDASITQTWARTIITHGSTQLAVLAMLLFGGDALFYFALALTIGIFASIYSSILIAGPVALRLGLSREDFLNPTKAARDGAVV
ncbi:MAG: protein translocase subunit SecF [Betaproteobacteria bacterium AqS2]|uniref:Protein-export membrane protein SecF n=1 Tax=Candidatus Amphirhobacter heronislandensis TaxID=1732024 RepID=A0A930UFZ3_9GAMM|nr:protein translocase subunit SecF [Betaproteobacteria bacterium AqS2]